MGCMRKINRYKRYSETTKIIIIKAKIGTHSWSSSNWSQLSRKAEQNVGFPVQRYRFHCSNAKYNAWSFALMIRVVKNRAKIYHSLNVLFFFKKYSIPIQSLVILNKLASPNIMRLKCNQSPRMKNICTIIITFLSFQSGYRLQSFWWIQCIRLHSWRHEQWSCTKPRHSLQACQTSRHPAHKIKK